MRILIKEKLSEHKSETPEGYLICQDAILARTGDQAYLKSEIYEDFDGEDMMVNVQRKPEQVFSSETLASFEDKPITVEHPDESVGPHNYSELAVGHTRNVRKGKFNGQDVMIADLVITDEQAIEDIKNGIRTELSCGYDCDITKGDHPEQINIRGNHVALCEEGRAGIAKIIDSKPIMDSYYYIGFLGEKEKERLKEGCKKYNCKFDIAGYEDGMADCYITGTPENLEKVVKGYTYKNFYPSQVRDSFHIKDMAMSKSDAMELCLALGKVFIEHFDKLYKEPENDASKHWGIEMKDKFDKVSRIILKHNNKPILSGNLRDWFFTAGANPENFMNNPTYDELAAYDKFVNELLSGKEFVEALNNAIGKESGIKDVNPKEGESKRAFIARFMSETKGEYPDRKQRYAVANSYWDKKDEKKVEDKMPALDRKIKNQISKYLHSISTFTKKDTDISEVLEPIHDMGYDTIVESINGWNKTDSGIYRKDYFCRVKGYPDVFMVSLYADPNKDWVVDEINAYFTGEKVDTEDIKIEDTEDVKIEDDPTNKCVIYKCIDHYCVTNYDNYYARIQNAREIYPIRGAESAEEAIDMLINNGWIDSREDVIVIGNDPIVDKANVTDDYPKKFYEKYLNLLKKKEKKLSKENGKVSDENEMEENQQKFNIYKEIKRQIKECEESLDK